MRLSAILPLSLGVTLAISAAAASADKALNEQEFDARTLGRTITYSADGDVYGMEQYLPGHKVLWSFADGDCQPGTWFENAGQICFDYGPDMALQCWKFLDTAEGLRAQYQGDEQNQPLATLTESSEPLQCNGPDVGV
jgi:hypothetical protein